MSRRRRDKRKKKKQQQQKRADAPPRSAPTESRPPDSGGAAEAGGAGGTVRPARPALWTWLAPVALALLTLAVYARSIGCPLIHRDDVQYLFEDPRIEQVSLGNFIKILTQPFFANYHPVTTFTYVFDRAVWGGWLPGHHLTQLAFYAGGVVLLYYVFARILANRPAAFAAAALYAAHTIHVESVAWLASRKDVVCLVFYAAAILAYLRYAGEKQRPRRYYALFVALGAAAMFAKGYAAVLPVVLLAYDYCFSRRIRRRQLLDKLPLLVLAVVVTLFMIAAQEKDATPVSAEVTFSYRLVVLCKVFAVYVGRTLLPIRLCAWYVVDDEWLNPGVAVLGALLGVGAFGGFFALRRRLPAAAFGIALFLLQLGTVMNTFFTLRTWMTDRYLFFPTIGSSLALGAGGLWLYGNRAILPGRWRWSVPAAGAAAVALYAALTVARLGVWTSEIGFWSDVLRRQNDIEGAGPVTVSELRGRRLKDIVPRFQLGSAYKRAGKVDEARALMGREYLRELESVGQKSWLMPILQFVEDGRPDEAIRELRPVARGGTQLAPVACTWMGIAYEKKGDPEAARRAYLEAVELNREHNRSAVWPLVRIGLLDLKAGRFEEAAGCFRRARGEAVSSDPRPVFYLGLTMENMGKLEEAYGLYEQTLELKGSVSPAISFRFFKLHMRMGDIAAKSGRRDEAARHFEECLGEARSGAERAEAGVKLGRLEFGAGEFEKAAERFRRARAESVPNDPRALFCLGLSLERLGRTEEARGLYEETLALKGRVPAGVPFNFGDAHQQMGKISEDRGLTKEAVRHYEELLRLVPDHPERVNFRLKVGIMQEGLGDAEEAVKSFEEVLRLAPDHPQRADIRLKMGLMEEKLGRAGEAVRHFEEALRLAPDHPSRADVSARIKQLRSRPPAPSAPPAERP